MPDWSLAEVEATVADYFDMFWSEVCGREYNKTAHRKRLSKLLRGRTDGAIERKHQNISAVLIDLEFVYIPGYKPSRNYQQLLVAPVAHRLANSYELVAAVRSQALAAAWRADFQSRGVSCAGS